jgi:ligand-binding SRPBCC domain-containing protein
MYKIYRETIIHTTLERCFDLSRSIDFHKQSMNDTKEIPVSGRLTGLIELGEFVEWEANHFFIRQRLSSKITEMVKPYYFVDVMVSGAFTSFWHKHRFSKHKSGEVMMIDDFRYEVPLGILGGFGNFLFLNRYMVRLIEARSESIKTALETDQWKEFITDANGQYA